MSDNKKDDSGPARAKKEDSGGDIAASRSELSSTVGSSTTAKTQPRVSSSSERQIKYERAQKCLENAARVSKRIKEHRKQTAELLGRPFEEDEGGDTASELAATVSERTGYSHATDTSAAMSVQDALNIPGISESLANTLKQKELLMERIKQYKEISKRPMKSTHTKADSVDLKKGKENLDSNQLLNTLKEKENALTVIQVKMKAMETTILDLQEKINEKDQIIEAKNKATTLISDSLSKKEKDSLVLLEDTRQQMIKMQENFVSMEAEWKEERGRLLKQLAEKDYKIHSLEEANIILENSRFEISVAHSKLAEELESKNREINDLQNQLEKLSLEGVKESQELTQKEKDDYEEEKGSIEIANMVELTKKIELLEQLNCQIRQTNKELENKLATVNPEAKATPSASPSKKASPLPARKSGRNTAAKQKSPWSKLSTESLPQETDKKFNKNELNKLEMVVQSLNKEILEKEYVISQKDSLINDLQSLIAQNETIIKELKESSKKPDSIEIGVITDVTDIPDSPQDEEKYAEEFSDMDPKELVSKLLTAKKQIAALNEEIDAANKNMIKVKSSHKLKLKQMQKTIDNFSKVSDSGAEIIRLNEELHQLSQKVAELEEEKGNLQLHLVDYDSGRLTDTDVYKKMVEMENIAEARLQSISLLEAQKFDLVQELHELQQKNVEMEDKLADMAQLQTEQVSTEIKSVQLEEQIDQLQASNKEFELIITNLKLNKEQLERAMKALEDEKEELVHKLENYIQENMELTDKLEKLSAEKVSSAESIEIVESLTTQEKLELEEYNKGLGDTNIESQTNVPMSQKTESIEKLVEQSAELNKKIELFTQEREEVMEKMSKITAENYSLHKQITEISGQCMELQNNIELLNNEKQELASLNEELNKQIEELKRERNDIMKDSVELVKPSSVDDSAEAPSEAHPDEKAGDKSNKGAKTVKQLTKDILKLKNIIKEREAEIGDCQMKILSLEEQQQKQADLIQSIASYESKVKSLLEENQHLKEEVETAAKNSGAEQQMLLLQQTNESLQQDLQKMHQDYASTVNMRDSRILELENLLNEYEKQLFNYGNMLQQKDKDIADYINQITKLNDVSQKLKSTIEILEEEKANDPNAELVKTLNKQIAANQKKLTEYEEKLKVLEEEKTQLMSTKATLESRNVTLESELKNLQDTFNENQNLIKDLQTQAQKRAEELSNVALQVKERDEEIHEIKLQLRKESIENEKLRTMMSEKENDVKAEDYKKELEDVKEKLSQLQQEKEKLSEQNVALETKSNELLEKLKKFAAIIKKKSSMYNDIEAQLHQTQTQLEAKSEKLDQLVIQVDTLHMLQDKLKHAEEELNRLHSYKSALEHQKAQDIQQYMIEIESLSDKLKLSENEILKLRDAINVTQKEVYVANEENLNLKSQLSALHNKLVDFEVEQKNNTNFVTKIASLESDINQKQNHITELLSKLEYQDQQLNQLQYGHDAKVQEHNLYVESLESEIVKYKNRICRLEDSISAMEDRRNSLERKADQLDGQLQEKQKAYSEYTNQEDHLVSRLAALMDHDRVVEKQLHEIENENRELQHRVQDLIEEIRLLKHAFSEKLEHCKELQSKANRAANAEAEIVKYQSEVRELDSNLKRITQEHQILLAQRKQDIEELESEFNIQIENAIKEKKALSEKYEKSCEHIARIEEKLHEYITATETLKINIEELTRINQELSEKSYKEPTKTPDYTEQYINEINRLNAALNAKNQEVYDINNKLQDIQSKYMSAVSNLESKSADLNKQLQNSQSEIGTLIHESNNLRSHNEHLQTALAQKEEQLKHFTEKKMTIEMKVPKTEGLIISSTIEAYKGARSPSHVGVSAIESQIVTDDVPFYTEQKHSATKISEQIQKQPIDERDNAKPVSEEVIVPKKTYLCYKEESKVPEQPEDPFNSDEGWGFGEAEDVGEVTPGLAHLTIEIEKLKSENKSLKADLEANHSKLVIVMRKFKEMKANNEVLAKEIQLSKQISQSSFLDSAIEDELKIKIQDLEKKIDELNTDLIKERRDKESVRKQNEVFHSANERLMEMKEKMDTEIELWKYKFKEANDKLSTMQWDSEYKDSPEHKPVVATDTKHIALQDDVLKLEKENDELQTLVDELTSQNKELTTEQSRLKTELTNLNQKLQQEQSVSDSIEAMQELLENLQKGNTELISEKESLVKTIGDLEVRYEKLESTYKKSDELFQMNQKQLEETQNELGLLSSELETSKSKLFCLEQDHAMKSREVHTIPGGDFALIEKYSAMEDYCRQMKQQLDNANIKIEELEAENLKLVQKTTEYEQQIDELKTTIQNLNTENDQLLSTVAELRSSVSSAVDQRGFEIAELWKQHLAQREMDFQKTEHELRTQLSAYEAKYDQLLDSVQSSSQEETNTLVMVEQVTSLTNKLQDKEEHLRNLQEKYAEVISQIDVLRSEMEDEKVECENKLLRQQEEYEKQILDLTLKNQQSSEDLEQAYHSLQTELTAIKAKFDEINIDKQDLLTKIDEYDKKIEDLTNQMKMKDAEIYQKTHDYTITINQRNEEFENVRKQLLDYEKKVEDLTFEKESELAVLRLKMHEKKDHYGKQQEEYEAENNSLSEALNEKIIECTNLNKQIADLNKTLAEYANNSTQMQGALENQEIEIVTLKEEINNLREMLRSNKIEKHVTFAADTKPPTESDLVDSTLSQSLLDAVPRAELDLAFYMLHQRDVRCEELTMELTRLLEERDTLQLRLSDSLRSYEDLKARCAASGLDVSFNASQETVTELPSFNVEREPVETHRGPSSRSSSISDPDGDKPKLQAKLSELRSVRHSRDVVLRHDSEQRQLDLRLLQRDVANLPPQALEQLTQAHHTLSRDSQSTPTVLLNWLRGKSTPKVVHM